MKKQKNKTKTYVAPDIDGYRNSGANQQCSRLISMAYLLNSIANGYNEQAFDILQSYGLMHKKIKTRCINLNVAFELYNKEIAGLIRQPEAQMQLCNDYDYFKELCDKFMNADNK